MQISRLAAGPAGPAVSNSTGGVSAATAVLNDASGAAGLGQQIAAYQTLVGRWRQAGHGERAGLTQALTASPFAQTVQSTLNSFTKAAWAGPDAVPPAPQVQILKAFDNLSADDQQIVAAMQADASGAPTFASAADYRARLQADVAAARPPEPQRRADSVTLSDEAQAHLDGGAAPAPASAPSQPRTRTRADLALAIAAYAKASAG
jgi:hypothetical protein